MSNQFSNDYVPNEDEKMMCLLCNKDLVIQTVTLSYMGNSFPVELLSCPVCQFTYIPEEVALGKMLRVERALENK